MNGINLDTLGERFRAQGAREIYRGEAGLLAAFKNLPGCWPPGDYNLRGILNGNRFSAIIGIWNDNEGILVRDKQFRKGMDFSWPYHYEEGLTREITDSGTFEISYIFGTSNPERAGRLAVSNRFSADNIMGSMVSSYVETYSDDDNSVYDLIFLECLGEKDKIAELSGEDCLDCPQVNRCSHRIEVEVA